MAPPAVAHSQGSRAVAMDRMEWLPLLVVVASAFSPPVLAGLEGPRRRPWPSSHVEPAEREERLSEVKEPARL